MIANRYLTTITTYYKITNAKEIHHDHIYHDGLNILNKSFDETGSCVSGGFYFTTLKYIHKFYSYGVYIREIYLPQNDPEFRMVLDSTKDKYRANKIILGKKYSLLDPSTYSELCLDITKNDYFVLFACKYNRVDSLEWWKTSGIKLKYSNRAIDLASKYGHIDVLNWWRISEIDLKYSSNAMTWASSRGYVIVLEWWKNSGFPLKYGYDAIELASSNGQIVSLEWWANSGLELFYHCNAIDLASANNQIVSLDWWLKSDLDIIYSSDAIDSASANGHIDVLQWWATSPLQLAYSCKGLDSAYKNKKYDVFNWWKKSGLVLKYTNIMVKIFLIDDDELLRLLNWFDDK